MISRVTKQFLTIAVVLLLAGPRTASALSVFDVIMLTRHGYEAAEIVEMIEATGSAFDLVAADAAYLKEVGVSDTVVTAMLTATPVQAPEPDGETPEYAGATEATLEDLLLLGEAGVSDDVILAFVETRGLAFSAGAREVVALRQGGVSDVVIQRILTMTALAPESSQVPATTTADDYDPQPLATTPDQGGYGAFDYGYGGYGAFDMPGPIYRYPASYYGPSLFFGFSDSYHPLFIHHYTTRYVFIQRNSVKHKRPGDKRFVHKHRHDKKWDNHHRRKVIEQRRNDRGPGDRRVRNPDRRHAKADDPDERPATVSRTRRTKESRANPVEHLRSRRVVGLPRQPVRRDPYHLGMSRDSGTDAEQNRQWHRSTNPGVTRSPARATTPTPARAVSPTPARAVSPTPARAVTRSPARPTQRAAATASRPASGNTRAAAQAKRRGGDSPPTSGPVQRLQRR